MKGEIQKIIKTREWKDFYESRVNSENEFLEKSTIEERIRYSMSDKKLNPQKILSEFIEIRKNKLNN
jgi:hypothetical protein